MPVQVNTGFSRPTPWSAALISLIPFLWIGPIAMVVSYHPWWDPEASTWVFPSYGAMAILLVVAGLVIGAVRKFPRWSYPYTILGVFALTFGATYLLNGTPWDINHEALVLIGVFVLAILVTAFIPAFRPLYANIRADHTLLSYALYATAMLFFSAQDHDVIQHLNLLALAPSIFSLLGALAYLRVTSQRHRIFALVIAASLGTIFWLGPVFDGMMGSLSSVGTVLELMLVWWGFLVGLILAPVLIGRGASNQRTAG